MGHGGWRTMLSQEQLQAIVRATGRLPPGYENAWRPLQWQPQEAVSAALPGKKRRGRPPKQPQPTAPEPPPRPPPKPLQQPVQRKWPLHAPCGSVEAEVKVHLEKRLNSLVIYLEQFYNVDIKDGRMVLLQKRPGNAFDGLATTDTFYPDWLARAQHALGIDPVTSTYDSEWAPG